jgi:hypothetical protein
MKRPTLKQLMKRPALWIIESTDQFRITIPCKNENIPNGMCFSPYCNEWFSGDATLKDIYETMDLFTFVEFL